jgi:hypothetical protein
MAMLGVNGGLIGKRRGPSISTASGIWLPNEQANDQREAAWPVMNLISGLSPVLWYDFADTATVTVESSQITAVVDKGSAARNLTKSTTGPSYVDGINGLKCVDWGSSPHANFLRNTSPAAFTLAELYIVQDAAFGGSAPNFNGLAGNANDQNARLYGSGGGTAIDGYSAVFLGASTTSSTPSISSLDSPSLVRLRFGSPTSMTAGFILGNETVNFSLNRGWYGLVGEVIGFGDFLSDASRGALIGLLSSKWSLGLV